MESTLRALIESQLDLITSDESIEELLKVFNRFKAEGYIDSVEGALIGSIWGIINMQIIVYKGTSGYKEDKKLTAVYLAEDIILRRIPEIKQKIKMILNK